MKRLRPSAVLLLVLLCACRGPESGADAGAHAHDGPVHGDHDHDDHDAPPKGPHGGRLLRDGAFAIELAIFEDGVAPEYRAWPTRDGEPLAPGDVTLHVQLTRLGGRVDRFTFAPHGDHLRGSGLVREPHSFSVDVEARHGGRTSTWAFDSFEGRTTIPATIAHAAGVRTATAGPATLPETVSLYGRLVADPERQREIRARYPGLIRGVRVSVGDPVAAGDVLASIESNDSLREYPLTAPLAGVVTARDANPGEQSGDRVLFTVTDPRALVAELSVFPRDRERVRPGAEVSLRVADGQARAAGTVRRLEPQARSNQSVVARVPLEAAGPAFVPGSFVTADVAVATREVPLAVKTSALQAFRDFTVVYARVGDTYEVRMLELGREFGEWVEVLGGLEPGETYVTDGSFVIKADIEKSGASHDH